MSDPFPTRVHFFEGQFLRAADFAAEQAYHLQGLRRHNLAGHGWGIVHGLELVLDEGGAPSVLAGLAVDGYGRTLILPQYRSISPQAFADQGSDTLEVWLVYDRRPAGPGSGGSSCNGQGADRETETARVEVRAPDPDQVSVSGTGRPDGRRPLEVPPDDLDFGPTQPPPDDPARRWPVYLGQLQQTAEGELKVDPEGRPYAGLVGEYVRSPSGRVFLQIGAERAGDANRFAVFLDPGAVAPSPLPAPGTYPALAIDDAGQIKIYDDTTLYGDMTVDGGAVEFGAGEEYDEAQPWRMYHAAFESETDAGVTIDQLRIEMPEGGAGEASDEVVVGHWSAQKKQFVPCLTIRNDCTVIAHGNLELQGTMDIEGELIEGAQVAYKMVDTMAKEVKTDQTPVLNALVAAVKEEPDVMAELLARLVPAVEEFFALRSAGETEIEQEIEAEPDELLEVPGIGPVFAQRLQDAGVRTFDRLARLGDEELDEILRPQPFQRLNYEAWRGWAAERGRAQPPQEEEE